MKNILIYFPLFILLGSCGMSNNFNSQKFTSLKKIKPEKTELSSTEQTENEVSNNNLFSKSNLQAESPIEGTSNYFQDEANLEDDLSSYSQKTHEVKQGKTDFASTPLKSTQQLDEKTEKTPEEKKEDNMFYWMMTMFILAAPASIFLVLPAIPFYLTAFILAILLIKRINAIPIESQTQKQNRRKGLAIWVLIQWAIGLGIFYIAINGPF